jgi:hypothetical protein
MPRKPKSTDPTPPMASAPAGITLDEMGVAFANAAVLLERLGAAGVLAPKMRARASLRGRAIDKTDQGDQLVMPGAERRTIPGKPYSVEADGQLLLAGVAPVTAADRAQHAVDAPLRPRRRQRPPPPDGLFRR